MNTNTTIRGSGMLLAAIVAGSMAGAASGQVFLHKTDRDGGESVMAESIEIRIEDGAVTASVNGEEVPADRIRQEDGRVTILDEDGREIRSLNITPGQGEHFAFVFGDDSPHAWRGPDAFRFDPGQEPPVMLGMTMAGVPRALEVHLGLEAGTATMISGVYEDLPAQVAGLGEFDVIESIDGDRPASPEAIREALADKEPGDQVTLGVIQKGQRRTVKVTLEGYDAERLHGATYLGSGTHARAGLGPIWLPADGGDFRNWLVVPDGEWSQQLPRQSFQGVQKRMGELRDRMRSALRQQERRQPRTEPAPPDAGEPGGRLEDLDRRMADLERMLDRMLEKIERDR
jgi:hypothetical protein